MNERIKLLAEQAGMTDDKFGMFFAKDKHNEDGVDLEKFAELLVQECSEFVKGRAEKAMSQEILAVGDELVKHFGVKNDT